MARPYTVEIHPSEIEAESRRLNSAGQRRTLGGALEAVARRKAGLEQFGKSEAWGRALAAYALDHPNLDAELRPIIKAWRRALSMSYADFRGTLANLECSVSGDLVPRSEQA